MNGAPPDEPTIAMADSDGRLRRPGLRSSAAFYPAPLGRIPQRSAPAVPVPADTPTAGPTTAGPTTADPITADRETVVAAPARPRPRYRYRPGLDGMRAVAVVAVVAYHMEPAWFPGGFFGVDIFFVISGYLISSMLAAEWGDRARIDLTRFWLRRVRRLYPAVVVLVVAVVLIAAVVAPSALVPTRTTIPAALVYLTNWWFIFHHVPYFQAIGRPPLFIHFWSLAIEEQYYLVWPPIMVLLLRRWRRPARVAAVALAGALASTVLMGVLYHGGGDINRIYYGSDTHAQGLLFGSALGLMVPPGRLAARVSPPAQRWLDGAGLAALGLLAVMILTVGQSGWFTWRGGLALVVVLAGIATVVAAHPASRLSRALSVRPLRWLGTRSYSIYLWHWPILDLTRAHVDVSFGGVPLAALQLASITVASEASYRLVEQPWRTGRAQAWVRGQLARGPRYRQASWAGAGCVVGLIVVLLATASLPPTPPSLRAGETSAARAAIVGQYPVGPSEATTPATTPTTEAPGRLGTTPTSVAADPTTTTPSTVAGVPGLLRAASGGPVLAIGDSVMLASSSDLEAAFGPAITVDAAVGRQVYEGLDRLQQYEAAGRLQGLRALVVGLGTNGPFEPSQLHQLEAITQGVPKVVLVNVRVPLSWQTESNATIASVATDPRFTVVNWYAASAAPGLLYSDAVHPDPAGQVVYANLVTRAVGGDAPPPPIPQLRPR